jgi:hypothetical protein
MTHRALVMVVGCLLGLGCSAESDETSGPPVIEQTCFAPEGIAGSPSDVDSLVGWVNALPRPLTLPCFLQTLPRPLTIDATWNTFSLQPAFGPNNPRIFIYSGDLAMSVVPKGEARPLLEFGVATSPSRTIKGELEFPMADPLLPSAPFDRIRQEDGTRCAFCHFNETLVAEIDYAEAFTSDIVPIEGYQRVDLDYIKWAQESCDRVAEPDRCDMLDGVFAFGDVVEQPD